jgi:hypothetical protein
MTIYLFAYGSLINTKYNKQINNNFFKKYIPVNVYNIKRYWIKSISTNNIYLDIKNDTNSITNGILIEVDNDDLERLDIREKYYTRKIIDKKLISFDYNINLVFNNDDIIYSYFSDGNKIIPYNFDRYNIQCKTYLLECLEGCIYFGTEFFNNFIYTTDFSLRN